jgi:hypothetical protein
MKEEICDGLERVRCSGAKDDIRSHIECDIRANRFGLERCCGSGMFYPGSGSDHFLIPDPGSGFKHFFIPDPRSYRCMESGMQLTFFLLSGAKS